MRFTLACYALIAFTVPTISIASPNTTLPKSYNCRAIGSSRYFRGGAPLPKQIIGAYGPGARYHWNIQQGKINYQYLPTYLQALIGFGEASSGIIWSGATTPKDLECNLGWGCLQQSNPNLIWSKGIMYGTTPSTNKIFCHIIQLQNKRNLASGKMLMHISVYVGSWLASKDTNYQCPGTIEQELYQHKDLGISLNVMKASNSLIGALTTFPESTWRCKGKITQDFNQS